MRSLLAFCFGLIAVFSFANVCEGATSTDDAQEASTDLEVDSEVLDSLAEEIENELEEAIADMNVENEGNTSEDVASKPNPLLMFPSMTKVGKSQRKMNKDMAVKMASIVEQAVMLVANDILQTTILLQTDPADFLQSNTTSTSE